MTLTHSNAGRIDDELLISTMNSSSSCKRAVTRPRAFSRSSDIVWPPVTLYSRDIPLNVSDLICQPLRQMSEVTLLPLPVSAPMHTWVNALPGSTRRIFLMKNKNNFFWNYFLFKTFFSEILFFQKYSFFRNPFFQKIKFSPQKKVARTIKYTYTGICRPE